MAKPTLQMRGFHLSVNAHSGRSEKTKIYLENLGQPVEKPQQVNFLDFIFNNAPR